MKALYVVIPIVLLLISGAVFFIVSSGSDDNTDAINEETASTEEVDEPAGSVEEEGTDETDEDQENNLSEEGEQDNPTEEDSNAGNEQEASSEETTDEQKNDTSEDSAGNNENYNAAEQCIMSELTECEGVSTEDQFTAYQNLIEDGTLPQSPVSDCLPCAVKYSFEAEYGESKPIDISVLPRSEEAPEEINSHLQFVRQYLFALPGYYNDQNNEALEFYREGSVGQNLLTANKASGRYANHMTYSVHIDYEEQNPDGSSNVYIYRTYSHENTNGIYENYVLYNVMASDGRNYIIGYEEIENVRIE